MCKPSCPNMDRCPVVRRLQACVDVYQGELLKITERHRWGASVSVSDVNQALAKRLADRASIRHQYKRPFAYRVNRTRKDRAHEVSHSQT